MFCGSAEEGLAAGIAAVRRREDRLGRLASAWAVAFVGGVSPLRVGGVVIVAAAEDPGDKQDR